MSESMVTIPLKEYEELKRMKETLKTKNYAVIKYAYNDTLTFYTESEFAERLLKCFSESYTRIGLLEKSNSDLMNEREEWRSKAKKQSKKKWYQFCK